MPDLGTVSGKVTLDGKPVAGAMVMFKPVASGRSSSGTTSSDGSYELQYTVDNAGAMIGEHTVSVIVEAGEEDYEGDEEGEDVEADSGLPPSATDGSIKQTVKAGANTIDIAL